MATQMQLAEETHSRYLSHAKVHAQSTNCDFVLPSVQRAVVTPVVGKRLNLQLVDNAPVLQPQREGEVVVRVEWTGICRSDACFSVGPEPGFPSHDHIVGHEGIGRIVQSSDKSLFGKPVGIRYMGSTCDECFYCKKGLIESCPRQVNFPKHYNGTFQQYMVAPWTSLLPLPDWIFEGPQAISPAMYTAALCSGSTALKGIQSAHPRPGDVIIVVGVCGAIGHLTGMIAKTIFGARVIGVDFARKRDSFAPSVSEKVFDAFIPVVSEDGETSWEIYVQNLKEACHKLRGDGSNEMADAVIVTASGIAAFQNLPDLICDGGSIVCVGVPRGECNISVPLISLVERQIIMRGSMMGGSDGAIQVMEWIRDRKIHPHIKEVGLHEVSDCMNGSLEFMSCGKTVVRVGELV